MHMNWLEISIGIVFLICIITGLVRGAIRIMVSLIATIVTFVIVFFATPYVSQAVEKYTPLDDMIKQKVVSTMADAATSAITGGGTVSGQGLNEAAVKKALKAAGVSEEMLNRYGISISDIVNGKIDSSDLVWNLCKCAGWSYRWKWQQRRKCYRKCRHTRKSAGDDD